MKKFFILISFMLFLTGCNKEEQVVPMQTENKIETQNQTPYIKRETEQHPETTKRNTVSDNTVENAYDKMKLETEINEIQKLIEQK